ncbi:bifunctional 2-polyprenyl-6-hydroxyphenol methylase/3-demethylubiquinol 3-O-methyltransferase UbiG [Pedobacter sp. R20-19]|uniref:class I SAM-dependent methyltransferase n=1 Tax=Pedobacter sp. R20-19 TaxID=1270196 RepID=UPI00068CB9AD|nr:class I SAM-dependent methyltransferase [Pedobacter sp. R20-19]
MKNNKFWTGERLETHIYSENMSEHLHRYAFAMQFIENKVILDIACGEGYGSNLMAKKAKKVYGVDIDYKTIEKAYIKYNYQNLEFQVGATDSIPIPSNSIDIVISFETIEHHDKHEQMLSEIKRVLKTNGILIISSPDKKYYSEETGHNNEFHIKELYKDEFKLLVNSFFKYTTFYNQKYISGSILLPEVNGNGFNFYSGYYDNLNVDISINPIYNLAIASDQVFAEPKPSFFYNENVLESTRREVSESLKNTYTWKAGEFIIRPFRFFKNLFRK